MTAGWGMMTNLHWSLQKRDIQLGHESNWLSVAGNRETVVTLKSDGSLWRWKFPASPVTSPETAYATSFSTHSDWLAITDMFGGVMATGGRRQSLVLELRPATFLFVGPQHEPQHPAAARRFATSATGRKYFSIARGLG